jgi:hypothetical protein
MEGRGAIVLVPIVAGAGMIAAALAWFGAIQLGGEATGARVRLVLDSACASEAMRARAEDLGLAPVVEGASLSVTLPGLADDRAHVPGVLAAPGRLEVSVEGALRPLSVRNVGVQIALSGTPVTLLTTDQALPSRGVTAVLDGVPVPVESVNGGEIMLAAAADTPQDALRLATDRVVAIRHPLPCSVTVTHLQDVP